MTEAELITSLTSLSGNVLGIAVCLLWIRSLREDKQELWKVLRDILELKSDRVFDRNNKTEKSEQ